ncbi:MAG TPA: ORF6N domain-containing protein [Candidatus Edwardsbacteria bacterium]|nr:ORF6N domain-containing protein [Candidatus Edwardsbacteria bacterium]
MPNIITIDRIKGSIYFLRGARVLLSTHLAELYQVEPRALMQAVKRNADRFPDDFVFQLNDDEVENLKSQIVISSWGGSRRANPYAFTEQGIAMLSSVLRSKRAVQVNIQIMRTFVQLRALMLSNAALARKLTALEAKNDLQFKQVFEALRYLMSPNAKTTKSIGFKVPAKQ